MNEAEDYRWDSIEVTHDDQSNSKGDPSISIIEMEIAVEHSRGRKEN